MIRIDNPKTAVVRGAGAWGEIHPAYRRYAQAVRFHVEACPPRSPEYKSKIERRIRDHRFVADPSGRDWNGVEEIQEWTDEQTYRSARRRVCPATGTSVLEAWQAEKAHLGALPILPEPFDVSVTRPVSDDCLVSFEGRQYSVPFRYAGCQRGSKSPHLGALKSPHPRVHAPCSSGRTSPAFSLSFSRYELPRTLIVVA